MITNPRVKEDRDTANSKSPKNLTTLRDLYKPAALKRRLCAYAIDVSMFFGVGVGAVLFVAGPDMRRILIHVITRKSISSTQMNSDVILNWLSSMRAVSALLMLTGTLLAWCCYRIVTGACGGNSIGKRTCGIRIINSEGNHLGYAKSWRRFLPGQILAIIPIPGIGFACYLSALTRKDRRGTHDIIAGSYVVNREP